MSIFELFLTSISLSMDAFAASICKGLSNKKNKLKTGLIISLSFGIFQALMPLIGYFLGNIMSDKIIKFDHYIALILLTLIIVAISKYVLVSLINEANEKEDINNNIDLKEILILSIATSIDALVIGVTLSFLRVNIYTSVSFIGITTAIICFIGFNLGNIIGNKLNKYSKILGGIILIIIGIKIFIEHTT